MPGKKRHYEIWIGEQGSGKTYNMRRRVRMLAKTATIAAVFVCDRLNEYGDMGAVFRSWSDWVAATAEELPRVAVFQLGHEATAYEPVMAEAIRQGNCALVLDEAYAFAPSGSTWRGPKALEKIVFSGRHLTNIAGEECVVHLLIGAQYARTMNHSLWDQSRIIMCGTVSGESQERWVISNFGRDAWDAVAALGKHEWHALRGNRPALGPNRW